MGFDAIDVEDEFDLMLKAIKTGVNSLNFRNVMEHTGEGALSSGD